MEPILMEGVLNPQQKNATVKRSNQNQNVSNELTAINKRQYPYSVVNELGAKGWNRTTAIPGEPGYAATTLLSQDGRVFLHDR